MTDLASTTGLHRNTVSRRLRDLAARDLALQVEPHQWIRGHADPADCAGPTNGAYRRDVFLYADERMRYQLQRSEAPSVSPARARRAS